MKAAALAALLLVGCAGGDPPVFPVFPAECLPQASVLSAVIGLQDGADAGEARAARNVAIDQFAECLKALP